MAAGRSLSINISSTVKFLVKANRVPTKNTAQMDAATKRAKYPTDFV